MKLSILIVTYNSSDVIGACLDSLRENPPGCEHETIVVDNCSADRTAEIIARYYPEVTFACSERNLGFAGGNNLAASQARGELLFLLNPDTVVLPGAIDALVAAMDDPSVWVCGARLLDESGESTWSYGDLPTLRWFFTHLEPLEQLGVEVSADVELGCRPSAEDASHDVGYVSGAALMTRAEVWRRIGGLDERFFVYFEETDYCFHVNRLGGRVSYVSEAQIIHLVGTSFGDSAREQRSRYVEGALVFARKNYGPAIAVVLRTWMGAIRILARLRSALLRFVWFAKGTARRAQRAMAYRIRHPRGPRTP